MKLALQCDLLGHWSYNVYNTNSLSQTSDIVRTRFMIPIALPVARYIKDILAGSEIYTGPVLNSCAKDIPGVQSM